MTKRNKSKLTALIWGTVTAIVFTVVLLISLNPTKFYKFVHSFGNDFDTTSDFVKFLDVGQGDCALIYSNGYSAVIDLSEADQANEIAKDLSDCKINSINAVLISHLHADHIGSLPEIAELFDIEHLIMPEIYKDSIMAATIGRDIATKKGATFHQAKQGMNFNIGEFEITLLANYTDKSEENNRSIFVMAEIQDKKFLFTGDAETKAEKKLLAERLNLDCDVLKVAHHGSNSSTSRNLLKATTPEYAVISVGEDNSYSHPSKKTISSLKAYGSTIYRTDRNGDVSFNIENGEITVETEK